MSALFLADRDFSPKEFATATGLDRGGVSRWLSRWSQIGLAERHAHGRGVTYRAAPDPTLVGLRGLFLQYSDLAQDIVSAVEAMLPEAVSVAFDPFDTPAGGPTDQVSPLSVIVVCTGTTQAGPEVMEALRAVGERHGRVLSVRVLSSAEFADIRVGPGKQGPVVKPISTARVSPGPSMESSMRVPGLSSVYS